MSTFDSVEAVDAAVEDCVRTVFPQLSDDELRAATRQGLEAWDSLATLSLITLIEETWDVMLTDDEVAQFSSVEQIKTVMAARQGSSA